MGSEVRTIWVYLLVALRSSAAMFIKQVYLLVARRRVSGVLIKYHVSSLFLIHMTVRNTAGDALVSSDLFVTLLALNSCLV